MIRTFVFLISYHFWVILEFSWLICKGQLNRFLTNIGMQFWSFTRVVFLIISASLRNQQLWTKPNYVGQNHHQSIRYSDAVAFVFASISTWWMFWSTRRRYLQLFFCQSQRCSDNGVTPKWVATPFCSDSICSIDFSESCISSIIAVLTLRLGANGPLSNPATDASLWRKYTSDNCFNMVSIEMTSVNLLLSNFLPRNVWNSECCVGGWNRWMTGPWPLDRCYLYTHFTFSFVASFAHSSFVAYWKDIARIIVINSWYDSSVFISKNKNNNNNLLRIRSCVFVVIVLLDLTIFFPPSVRARLYAVRQCGGCDEVLIENSGAATHFRATLHSFQ